MLLLLCRVLLDTFQYMFQIPKTSAFTMINMNSSAVSAQRSTLSTGVSIVLPVSVCADDLSAPLTETVAQCHIKISDDPRQQTVSG